MGQRCQLEGAVSVKARSSREVLGCLGVRRGYGTDVVGGLIRVQMEKGLE